MSFFCETFPSFVLDGSSSPLFGACQFFHKLVGFLVVDVFAGILQYLVIVQLNVSFAFLMPFLNLLVCFSTTFCTFGRILLLFQFSPFCHTASVYFFVTQGFFAKDVDFCFCFMAMLKLLIKASISVSWFSKVRSGASFPPIIARKMSAMLGSLSFSRLNLILVSLVFHPLEAQSEGHHYKPMITSNIGSWKAPAQPACRHRADDDTDRLTVAICLHVQPKSGRCRPDDVTGRQSQGCPSNYNKTALPVGLQIHWPWPDVATSTTATGWLLLIGPMAGRQPNTALSQWPPTASRYHVCTV